MASDPPDTDMQPRVGSYSVEPFLKQEVSDQIRNRDPKKRVSWNWYDTWQEEHLRAFVVAKLCKADLLQEVHQSIQKAVDTGMTFAEWKKEVTPKLEGEWLGRTYGDIWENDLHRDIEELPETQREKLISPRRLETIYRTNMKVAHAAGQYQSLKDMADLYPYWRYCTIDDGRVRDEHMAMHNKVFRHDDPIWNTHYPPNSWNCRCYVRAMDEDDLEEAGLTVTDSRDLKKIKFEGEQSGRGRIAYGIGEHVMDTDDGWNYNPGKVSAQVAAMAKKKVDKLEPPLKREVLNAFEQKIQAEEKREAKLLELHPQQDVPAIQDDGGRLRESDILKSICNTTATETAEARKEQARDNDKGREPVIQREPEEKKPDTEQQPNTVEPSAEVKSGTEKASTAKPGVEVEADTGKAGTTATGVEEIFDTRKKTLARKICKQHTDVKPEHVERLIQHIFFGGYAKQNKDGVSGTHCLKEFKRLAGEGHKKILCEEPFEGLEGVAVITYVMKKKDMTGNWTNIDSTTQQYKTTFDDEKFTLEDYVLRVYSLRRKWLNDNPGVKLPRMLYIDDNPTPNSNGNIWLLISTNNILDTAFLPYNQKELKEKLGLDEKNSGGGA